MGILDQIPCKSLRKSVKAKNLCLTLLCETSIWEERIKTKVNKGDIFCLVGVGTDGWTKRLQ